MEGFWNMHGKPPGSATSPRSSVLPENPPKEAKMASVGSLPGGTLSPFPCSFGVPRSLKSSSEWMIPPRSCDIYDKTRVAWGHEGCRSGGLRRNKAVDPTTSSRVWADNIATTPTDFVTETRQHWAPFCVCFVREFAQS